MASRDFFFDRKLTWKEHITKRKQLDQKTRDIKCDNWEKFLTIAREQTTNL